jgi:cytidylate kinase
MTTVTISRDFGSEGDKLARRIAQDMGYHFVDKEIIGHLLGSYGFVEFDKEYDSLLGFWANFDSQRGKRRELIVEMLNNVLEAFAFHGNVVILGRSGFSVLGRFADVFHVRLQAPFQVRVRRLMVEENLTLDEATTICEDGDKVRSGFVQEFYGISWDAAHAFDLVINTDKIESDLALSFVVDALKAFETTSKKGEPTTQVIVVDAVLARAVNEVLNCTLDHSELNPALVMHQ